MKVETREREHWVLDKRIPIALIIGLIVQSAGIVWWARGQEAQDVQLNQRVTELEAGRKADRVPERLAVIEHQLREQREATTRIEARLLQIQYGPSSPPGRTARPELAR